MDPSQSSDDNAFVLLASPTSVTISPVLAYYLHDLDPIIFRIYDNVGPRWYGLAYVLAFISGYAIYRALARMGYADLPMAKIGDFITGCALFGVIIGGRLGYVLFYKPDMLREPLSILRVWEGGMSSHGGMIGIFLFALYYSRRQKISWLNLGDNLVVVAPLGLFFGRCANFINGELYGRLTNVSWAMQFPKELLDHPEEAERAIRACIKIDPSLASPEAIVAAVHRQPAVKEVLRAILVPRHPSQLYEAFFEGIVLFVILWFVRTRLRQPNGVLIGLFFFCYAVFRIVIENFREPDSSLIAGVTRGQFLSFFLIVMGLAFIVAGRTRPAFPKHQTPTSKPQKRTKLQ
jgi:phosphatidylglycerol:prolipoprotein diacylglycerol transferase